jgi:hypothetical protein
MKNGSPNHRGSEMPVGQQRAEKDAAILTQDDLLILLIEECAEVTQAATKCLRFGFDVDHGVNYGNNRLVLSREIGDVLGVVDGLSLDQTNIDAMRATKLLRARVAKEKFGRKASEVSDDR